MNVQICRHCWWPILAKDEALKICHRCHAATWILIDIFDHAADPAAYIWLMKGQNYASVCENIFHIQRQADRRAQR